jgi:peptidoglycan lytic transglycosylase
MITFTLAIIMWVGWNAEPPTIAHAETVDDVEVLLSRTESCHGEDTGALLPLELPSASIALLPVQSAPRTGHDMLDTVGIALANVSTSGVDLISYAKRKMLLQFTTMYRAVLQRVAMMGLSRIQHDAALTHSTIVGMVSTYNPYRDGNEEGGPQTASGEPYDPAAWTAAIKTDLRNQFGGIRYGKLYQPAFALVESDDKQLIVKINDVGPLKPGRVLDLSERSMRHFDPFLTRGLIQDVKITLLPGEDWTPGPVDAAYAIDFSGSEWRAASASRPAEDFRSSKQRPALGVMLPSIRSKG